MITRSVQLSSEFAFNKNLQRVTATFLIDFLKLMFLFIICGGFYFCFPYWDIFQLSVLRAVWLVLFIVSLVVLSDSWSFI